MSFSFNEGKGCRPFVKIIGAGKYNNELMHIDPNTNEMDTVSNFKGLEIHNNSNFQLVPGTSHERDVMMVVGPSGSGKSYAVKNIARIYQKNKDRNIYVSPNLKGDSSLDTFKKNGKI